MNTRPDSAKPAADAPLESLKTTASAAGADLSAAGSDLYDLTRQAIAEMRRIADEYASRTGGRAGEAVGVLADDARAIGRDGIDALAESVSRRPVTSLAIAAGVGLVLGWATRSGPRA